MKRMLLGVAVLGATMIPAGGALASSDQPSLKASCQGQVNGYYNRNFSDGGQLTSAAAKEDGYSDAVVLGAQSHDCNVPAGVPAGPPKRA